MNKYLEKVAEIVEGFEKEASRAGVARAMAKKWGSESAGAEELGRLAARKHAKSIDEVHTKGTEIQRKANKAKSQARDAAGLSSSSDWKKPYKAAVDKANRVARKERTALKSEYPHLSKATEAAKRNFSPENAEAFSRGAKDEFTKRHS